MNGRAFRPATLAEALTIRGGEAVRPVAGGTDLMVARRRHAPAPVRLDAPPLFIAHLSELRYVRLDGDRTAVGAATTLHDLADSPGIDPGLKKAIRWFASPAIRNVATIGGNICNASPAADLLPYLVAVDATLVLQDAGGAREVAVREFITGPGRHVLTDAELLTEVRFPARDPVPRFRFYRKVAPRRSNALSKLSLYVEARVEPNATIRELRMAAGAIAPTVVRFDEAERIVEAQSTAALGRLAGDAVEACMRAMNPIDDQRSTAAYRMSATCRLIRRVLEHDLPSWRCHDRSDHT